MPAVLTRGQRVGCGVGSFGTGGFGTVPGLLLLFYLTDTLGVAAAVTGQGAALWVAVCFVAVVTAFT